MAPHKASRRIIAAVDGGVNDGHGPSKSGRKVPPAHKAGDIAVRARPRLTYRLQDVLSCVVLSAHFRNAHP
jgi:hypothetical protein